MIKVFFFLYLDFFYIISLLYLLKKKKKKEKKLHLLVEFKNWLKLYLVNIIKIKINFKQEKAK
jgi:hypothetical protein